MCSLRRMPNASPISGSRKSRIAHIRFTDGPSITRPIRVRGENIPSEHVNYAPGQSPGHRPLTSAEFHESLSRIYMLGKRECWSPLARPHSSSPASPPPPHPSLPMYNQFTVHRSCATISVNYCERLRRTVPTSQPKTTRILSLRDKLNHSRESDFVSFCDGGQSLELRH